MLALRQKDLLQHLLKHKEGMTMDELSVELHVTRNAVRQHLAALEADGLVTQGVTRPSGGRPRQLFVLTEKGKECFPRHYSWFAQLLVESIASEVGQEGLRARLEALGGKVADQLLHQYTTGDAADDKVRILADLMEHLGYAASASEESGTPVIEADNCVFHALAMKNPDICHFDLALLEKFTGSRVEHQKCMARGEHVCRFKLKNRK
jgi:predicted ArsR family transcriptional regulator